MAVCRKVARKDANLRGVVSTCVFVVEREKREKEQVSSPVTVSTYEREENEREKKSQDI